MTYYANMVPPQAEFRIERKLRCSGYDAKVYKEQRFIRRKKVNGKRVNQVKVYPLMRGYLVLKTEAPLDPAVMESFKLRAVHGAGDWYGKVSSDEIGLLEGYAQKAPASALPNTTIGRVVGERVVLRDGPFNSFPGTITEIDGGEAMIDVELFGRITPVRVKLDALEAA